MAARRELLREAAGALARAADDEDLAHDDACRVCVCGSVSTDLTADAPGLPRDVSGRHRGACADRPTASFPAAPRTAATVTLACRHSHLPPSPVLVSQVSETAPAGGGARCA